MSASFIIYFRPRFIFLYIELFYGNFFYNRRNRTNTKRKTKTNLLDRFFECDKYFSHHNINITLLDGDTGPRKVRPTRAGRCYPNLKEPTRMTKMTF